MTTKEKLPPVKSELGSRPANDCQPSAERYERERDRQPLDAPRSFSLPWLPKVHASLASMELWSLKPCKHVSSDDEWRWATVSSVLAECFSCFDAHLDEIFVGHTAIIWHFKDCLCPIHRVIHEHNRWSLCNVPYAKHTTKVTCFHSKSNTEQFLVTHLPLGNFS